MRRAHYGNGSTAIHVNEKLKVAVPEGPSSSSEVDRLRLQRMFAVYHATVWRILRRRGLSSDAAADATQQTFLVAARRLADIEPNSERAFLVATSLRVARALQRKTERLELEAQLDERLSADGTDLADVELCDLALSKLNPDLAEVLVLYEIEGFSATEIAQLLEIPMGSVASRLRRAREQFRAAVTRLERGLVQGART